MKNAARLLIALPFIFWVMGCKKDDPTLGDPPTTADAAFTYAASATSDNIIVFTATNSDLTANGILETVQRAKEPPQQLPIQTQALTL